MSKAAKKIGGAVKKVWKGTVGKVFKEVKRFAKSKFGKVLLTAVGVYFGGAAIAGAVGGAGAGSGFLGTLTGAIKGAGAGLSSAMGGVSGAWGAITGGQGLGAAGSALGSGFTGAYGAGQAAVGGASLANAGASAAMSGGATAPAATGTAIPSGANTLSPINAGIREAGTGVIKSSATMNAGAGAGLLQRGVGAAVQTAGTPSTWAEASKLLKTGNVTGEQLSAMKQAFGESLVEKTIANPSGGLLKSMMSNPLTGYAAMQVGGSMLQGYGADKAEDERIDRINENMGTRIYGNSRYRSAY